MHLLETLKIHRNPPSPLSISFFQNFNPCFFPDVTFSLRLTRHFWVTLATNESLPTICAKLYIHLNSRIGVWDICCGKNFIEKTSQKLSIFKLYKMLWRARYSKHHHLLVIPFCMSPWFGGINFNTPQGKDLAYRTLSSPVLITCNIEFLFFLSIGGRQLYGSSANTQLSGLLFHLQRKKIFLIHKSLIWNSRRSFTTALWLGAEITKHPDTYG